MYGCDVRVWAAARQGNDPRARLQTGPDTITRVTRTKVMQQ